MINKVREMVSSTIDQYAEYFRPAYNRQGRMTKWLWRKRWALAFGPSVFLFGVYLFSVISGYLLSAIDSNKMAIENGLGVVFLSMFMAMGIAWWISMYFAWNINQYSWFAVVWLFPPLAFVFFYIGRGAEIDGPERRSLQYSIDALAAQYWRYRWALVLAVGLAIVGWCYSAGGFEPERSSGELATLGALSRHCMLLAVAMAATFLIYSSWMYAGATRQYRWLIACMVFPPAAFLFYLISRKR